MLFHLLTRPVARWCVGDKVVNLANGSRCMVATDLWLWLPFGVSSAPAGMSEATSGSITWTERSGSGGR